MSDDFLAQTLNSRQLLALLFICENKRKGHPLSVESMKGTDSISWKEFLEMFSVRFANLTETMRFEVLEAHLMSVEDLDVYHNETLKTLLDENQTLLTHLTGELGHDPRFA
jgi:hypothetical protein